MDHATSAVGTGMVTAMVPDAEHEDAVAPAADDRGRGALPTGPTRGRSTRSGEIQTAKSSDTRRGGYLAGAMSTSSPDFSAALVDDQGSPRLLIAGELDAATAPDLEEALAGVEPGTPVDALGLTFCDSTGLSRLIAASRRYDEAGQRLVVHASPSLRRTIDLAGVASCFELPDATG
jgi:anti-anti-sigma factor